MGQLFPFARDCLLQLLLPGLGSAAQGSSPGGQSEWQPLLPPMLSLEAPVPQHLLSPCL